MDDLTRRLEKRQRAKVAPRVSMVGDQAANATQILPVPLVPQEQQNLSHPIADSVSNIQLLPEDDYKNFELAQATLRIEKHISERMKQYCQGNGGDTKISREALIEAMFLQLEADSGFERSVIEAAQKRSELRKRAGNFKRGKSISERA